MRGSDVLLRRMSSFAIFWTSIKSRICMVLERENSPVKYVPPYHSSTAITLKL